MIIENCISLKNGELIILKTILCLFILITGFILIVGNPAFASPTIPLGELTHSSGDDILGGVIPDNVGYLNFQTVAYTSDGKFLNVTYYLREPFTPTIVKDVSYILLIDADSDPTTGIAGIDYIYNKTWSGGKWITTYEQIVSSGDNLVLYKHIDPYVETDNPNNAINLSLDLKRIGSPDNYLVSFVARGEVDNASDIRQVSSYLVTIPTPTFSMDISPTFVSLSSGDEKFTTLQIHTNSKVPYELQQDLIFSTKEGINVRAVTQHPYKMKDGVLSIPLQIKVPDSVEPNYYIAPITVYASFYRSDYFSASNINNDVIKKSLYSTQPILQHMDLPITVVKKDLIDLPTLVAISTAFIAITGVFLTTLYSKKQFRETKRDMDARIRPIITRSEMTIPIKFIQSDGITIPIINRGSSPAVNMSWTWYVRIKDGENYVNTKTSEENNPGGIILGPLAPSESYGIKIKYDNIHYAKIMSDDKCYFGLSITYHDPLNKEYIYKIEGHFNKSVMILDGNMSTIT